MNLRLRDVVLIVAASSALLLIACESPRQARIAKQAALFESLDPRAQQIIREGLVDYGFTPEMVYLALGRPNAHQAADGAGNPAETWTYRNFLYANAGAVRLSGNIPGNKPYGPIVSSSAPGGPSLASTKAGPAQPTIGDGSETALGTLIVEFRQGRVSALRIEP